MVDSSLVMAMDMPFCIVIPDPYEKIAVVLLSLELSGISNGVIIDVILK